MPEKILTELLKNLLGITGKFSKEKSIKKIFEGIFKTIPKGIVAKALKEFPNKIFKSKLPEETL